MRDNDVNLPWQFVLLGFLAFGALFAGMLLVFSFIPNMQMSKWTIGWVRWISIPYLAIGIGAMPYLIREGRRSFSQLNPEFDAMGRRAIRMPRGKRFVIAAIAFCAGLLMTLHSYSEAIAAHGGRYTIYFGLVGIGLAGMVSAALAEDEV